MINTFSKIIAAFIAALLLICAVSCSGGSPGDDTSGGEVTVPDSGRASNVQAKDYDGYTFIFSDTELHLNKYDHKFPEIEADPTSDEAVEVAVYRRNDYLRAKYNVEIVSDTELNINNILAAGDDVFDASCNGPYETKSAVQNGYYLDLREFDNVFNFKEDWWWDDSNSEIAYNGRYFQVTGDANIRSLGSVNVTFFNKVVLEDFAGNADLYALVDSGEWTFDKMLSIAKPVGLDLNGDTIYDETDRYGFANNNFGVIAYFYSQGCRFITKDEDGEVEFSYGDKKQVEVLTKIVEILNDSQYTLYGEKYKNLMDNGRVLVGQAAFAEDRALFTTDLMSRGLLMRALEQDYGILPMPKYDINQKEYIQYLH
ncbi:MAG: hypothetical protein IKS28_01060, partial [Clostridia bacterium]|nr:hypothetical protein [Clostridia bacterium]